MLVYLTYAINHPHGYGRDPSVAVEADEVAGWVPARWIKVEPIMEAIYRLAGQWLDTVPRRTTAGEWRSGPEPLIEPVLRFHTDYVAARVENMATGAEPHLTVEDPHVPLHAAAASAAWVGTLTPNPRRTAEELGRKVLAEITLF